MLFTCASTAAAQSRVWDFQAFLDDKPIGHHRFTLNAQGDTRELKSETRFVVKLLFLTAYRYTHDAVEHWRGDCLERLRAQTDDNGEQSTVEAAVAGDRIAVDTAKGRATFAGCIMSFAYWNPSIVRQRHLLNPQNGDYEDITVEDKGVFTMPWSATVTYGRPVGEWIEHVCAENTNEYYNGSNSAIPTANKPDF